MYCQTPACMQLAAPDDAASRSAADTTDGLDAHGSTPAANGAFTHLCRQCCRRVYTHRSMDTVVCMWDAADDAATAACSAVLLPAGLRAYQRTQLTQGENLAVAITVTTVTRLHYTSTPAAASRCSGWQRWSPLCCRSGTLLSCLVAPGSWPAPARCRCLRQSCRCAPESMTPVCHPTAHTQMKKATSVQFLVIARLMWQGL